ncbi:zinc metallopeptidase [candidate division KSB1 bacterium]
MWFAFFNPAVLVIIPVFLIYVTVHFYTYYLCNKYSSIALKGAFTGYETANEMLLHNSVNDISIERERGFFVDKYDHHKKILVLSHTTYDSNSVTATAIAAHEASHALQYMQHKHMRSLRLMLSTVHHLLLFILVFLTGIGFIFQNITALTIGLYTAIAFVLFNILSYFFEYRTNNIAVKELRYSPGISVTDIESIKKVLKAVSVTYLTSPLVRIILELRHK